jgi:hypothetical protein
LTGFRQQLQNNIDLVRNGIAPITNLINQIRQELDNINATLQGRRERQEQNEEENIQEENRQEENIQEDKKKNLNEG